MASSSSSGANPLSGQPVPEKLTRNNFLLWKTQILPAIRGARMEGYITGAKQAPAAEIDAKEGDKVVKVTNPAYETWVAEDQQVLGYILASEEEREQKKPLTFHSRTTASRRRTPFAATTRPHGPPFAAATTSPHTATLRSPPPPQARTPPPPPHDPYACPAAARRLAPPRQPPPYRASPRLL
uniref:Retrotransposon Copia-like N-terminal domain-containing protein n=1 Tax=Oryza barthii TaxID=65489 RepID=A0A0D3HV43_9ORYZ